MKVSASIVLYNTESHLLSEAIASFAPSAERKLFLVDNSPHKDTRLENLDTPHVDYIFSGENRGYGAGHNIAIRRAIEYGSDYHVVLNPDIRFSHDVIDKLVSFADEHKEIAHLMPKIVNPAGEVQHLCKLIPTPFDLIFKRFLPKALTARRAERFQLKFADYEHIMDVPYLSGCFMFFRVAALKEVGLFDERFFMYPEDIDITRRMHERFRTVYYPEVCVIHDHAAESYKSARMLKIHMINMVKYFNKWGWFFDAQRKKVNRETLISLGYKKQTAKAKKSR